MNNEGNQIDITFFGHDISVDDFTCIWVNFKCNYNVGNVHLLNVIEQGREQLPKRSMVITKSGQYGILIN